jgi:hypothetical protein
VGGGGRVGVKLGVAVGEGVNVGSPGKGDGTTRVGVKVGNNMVFLGRGVADTRATSGWDSTKARERLPKMMPVDNKATRMPDMT